jgi:hypothetical protein
MTTMQLYKKIVEFDENSGIVINKNFTIKGEELSELRDELEIIIRAVESLRCIPEEG